MDYASEMQRYVNLHMKREQDIIEEMCEQMLTTPDSPGISVQRTWKGLTCTTEVRLNPVVPFGVIGYLPDIHEPGFS